VLIAVGCVLVFGERQLIQLTDDLVTWRRSHEIAGWERSNVESSRRPAARAPASPTVIAPGKEGYLLFIPKINVRAIVRELEPEVFAGVNTPALRRFGLGQVPYTRELRNVSPGAVGTAAITGHRTTSGAPFRHIDRLRPGDLIILRKSGVEHRWIVVGSAVVPPNAIQTVRSRVGVKRLILLACTPPFTARERLLVTARFGQEIRFSAEEANP
jgi:LPXTG-site transpeptidase (sortase) family protein